MWFTLHLSNTRSKDNKLYKNAKKGDDKEQKH